MKSINLNKNDVALLDALDLLNGTDYAAAHGNFFATNDKLRKMTGIASDIQLLRSLRKLVKNGIIDRTPGKRGEASTYIFHDPQTTGVSIKNTNKNENVSEADYQTVMNKNPQNTLTKNENVSEMLVKLIINELRPIINEIVSNNVSEMLVKLQNEMREINANLLKISNTNKYTNKNEIVSPDPETEKETEKEINKEKDKEKETQRAHAGRGGDVVSGMMNDEIIEVDSLAATGNVTPSYGGDTFYAGEIAEVTALPFDDEVASTHTGNISNKKQVTTNKHQTCVRDNVLGDFWENLNYLRNCTDRNFSVKYANKCDALLKQFTKKATSQKQKQQVAKMQSALADTLQAKGLISDCNSDDYNFTADDMVQLTSQAVRASLRGEMDTFSDLYGAIRDISRRIDASGGLWQTLDNYLQNDTDPLPDVNDQPIITGDASEGEKVADAIKVGKMDVVSLSDGEMRNLNAYYTQRDDDISLTCDPATDYVTLAQGNEKQARTSVKCCLTTQK